MIIFPKFSCLYTLLIGIFFYSISSHASPSTDLMTGEQQELMNHNTIPAQSAVLSLEPTLMPIQKLGKLDEDDLQAKSLILYGVADESLTNLSQFKDLQELCLSGLANKEDNFSQHLKGLVSLTKLGCSKTWIVDSSLENIGKLTKLRILDLSNTHIGGKGLENLRSLIHLESLDISETLVGDKSIINLEPLFNLATLNLTNTRVSQGAAEKLKEEIIELRKNKGLEPIEFNWTR